MENIHSAPSDSTHYVNLERLIFLIDGVFAITITLLVLELRPPEDGVTHLAKGLLEMLPRLYIYLIAFYSIANHWVVHQRMFRHITGADTTMLWLTLLGLLFITLIPATTAIVGRFPAEGLAVATFSANSFFQALANWIFWTYVLKRHNQFAAQSNPQLLSITAQVWLVISVGWLVSILLGFLNVNVAYAAWIVWPNLVGVWGNAKRRKLQVLPDKKGGRNARKKNKA
ncbi:MAG: TMEM175 family protein [Anaerolineales bacterium]